MKIDWDIKNPPTRKRGKWQRALRTLRGMLFNTNVPLCHSNHYNRDHFTKESHA